MSRPLPPPRVRQAVILAGGKGTRLGELTKVRPKPMMQITEKECFLDFMIDNLARQGFERITILAGYLGEQMAHAYDGHIWRGARVEVTIEAEPKGTGGALCDAASLLEERFLLLNGDTYFDIDYRSLEALAHAAPNPIAVMALRSVPASARYGSVELDGSMVTAFNEKSEVAGREGLINAGIYLLDRRVLNFVPEGASSLEHDVFPRLVDEGALSGCELKGYFIDIGLPDTLSEARAQLPRRQRRPALFLDRDGVLNIDHGYVHRWDQFDWIEGAAETIAAFNAAGYFVFVVTNQAGVAHGYYSEEEIHQLHNQIQNRLATLGGHIDAFYYCPFHPEGSRLEYRLHDNDRKPGPGMLLKALTEWRVDAAGSFLVGDKSSDIAAAHAAGIDGLLFEGGDLRDFLHEAGRFPPAVGEFDGRIDENGS